MSLKSIKILGIIIILCVCSILVVGYSLQEQLMGIYQSRESLVIKDRHSQEIFIQPNQDGYWARYQGEFPDRLKQLVIQKEDRYFYYHFGFNPWSIFEAFLRYIGLSNRTACSTISQQLVKVLLGKELERNLKNKIVEAFYTMSLEMYKTKDEILRMYLNSVYFGNQAQGVVEASRLYFNLPVELLTDGQILQLLATLHSPAETNPASPENSRGALFLARKLGLKNEELVMTNCLAVQTNMENYSHFNDAYFEIHSLISDSFHSQKLTCDLELTNKIRNILQRNIERLESKNVKNGAVIVIKLPENEILTLIGSPDPKSFQEGYQINMLAESRPIGSTVKPFIYLKAFEKGLRPYTLIDDREYKYITALGFPLYPKNFDYKYRGEVNLHYALSNSLNVPSVKVLEYVGLEDFYQFLEKDLEFQPIQALNNYQLGIALGALEMNLYDLARYFTIFPNNGILRELKITDIQEGLEKKIASAEYIQLINKILSDRKTGIEQFGLVSELNLSKENYALKTGTSRDFHDSWVIGYTPDFLVGVWLGNAENTAMDAVSGQTGAGLVWSQIMELLFNSQYNKKTPFDFSLIQEFNEGENLEYGLARDDYQKFLNVLKEKDTALILNPHEGDVFLLEEHTNIILEAQKEVKWFIHPVRDYGSNETLENEQISNGVNGEFLAQGEKILFSPQEAGNYRIKAQDSNGLEETININIYEAN